MFFNLINSYVLRGNTELLPPYIPGDKDHGSGWIWSKYSQKRMLECIIDTYTKAICEYKDFVDIFFGTLKEHMSTYLILPCILKGILKYDETGNDFSSGPSMTWYMIPLPLNEQSFSQIKYKSIDDIWNKSSEIFDELKKKVSLLRPENDHYMYFTIHSGRCFDASETPVTDIIYTWLENDLKKIGWIK